MTIQLTDKAAADLRDWLTAQLAAAHQRANNFDLQAAHWRSLVADADRLVADYVALNADFDHPNSKLAAADADRHQYRAHVAYFERARDVAVHEADRIRSLLTHLEPTP